jgi:hypothetical protein
VSELEAIAEEDRVTNELKIKELETSLQERDQLLSQRETDGTSVVQQLTQELQRMRKESE